MPLKTGEMTKGETAFLAAYVELGDRAKAERRAGIAAGTGWRILARPAIQAQLVERQVTRVTSELLPLALDTLKEIMSNARAPAAARVQAAKIVVDRGLPAGEDGRTKELHEMTPDELAQAIATLEGQAAALARPVPQGGVFD